MRYDMQEWKICYMAKTRLKHEVLDPEKPWKEAYMDGETPEDAVRSLMSEFPMWKLKIGKIEKHVDRT
jgi:hypothetical protein